MASSTGSGGSWDGDGESSGPGEASDCVVSADGKTMTSNADTTVSFTLGAGDWYELRYNVWYNDGAGDKQTSGLRRFYIGGGGPTPVPEPGPGTP